MQIVIPMSGVGQRFIDAGYAEPKPLIEIDEKPIIEHVVNLFPGECKFMFICNSYHLEHTNMREVLKRVAPSGKIFEIPKHKKGPVYAVSKIYEHIDDEEEVIVNYCDFSTYWDYSDFLKHTRNRDADGAIPAYRDFHPHMLGSTNYAFMRDQKQWLLDIKEKEPFTDNRNEEFASNGTYYFKSGKILKTYFDKTLDSDLALKGEYYVSLVYKKLLEDNLKISIYKIQHMLQWGTPQDVEEYNMWSNYFSKVVKEDQKPKNVGIMNVVIPMAGAGSRFVKEGYTIPKPLISVSGKAMIEQVVDSLPTSSSYTFICQNKHIADFKLEEKLSKDNRKIKVIGIDGITEGQACTTKIGIDEVDNNDPILIAACDNGMIWNTNKFKKVLSDDPDFVVWSFQNYAGANKSPEMYGWIKFDGDIVTGVSVKKPVSEKPKNDQGIVGAFYFKNKEVFNQCYSSLVEKKIRVNNEFYIDSMVEVAVGLGFKVKSFLIDDYLCWGTPNDLRTFEYWQSFFDKCCWHPYSLEKDQTVEKSKVIGLRDKYHSFEQEYR